MSSDSANKGGYIMDYGILEKFDPSRLPVWKAGRPAELWLSHRELIGKFITTHRLKPLAQDEYPYLPMPPGMDAVTFSKISTEISPTKFPWPIPFPGGMRIPHLHFGRDVFLLTPDHWKELSKSLVKDMQSRIANAKEIGFDQVVELGQVSASIGH